MRKASLPFRKPHPEVPPGLEGTEHGDAMPPIRNLALRLTQFLCQSRNCSRSSQTPDILRLVMAKDVTVSVVHEDAKESRSGGIPAILNRHDLPGSVCQIQPHGALVRLISRIALHTDDLFTHGHWPAPFCGSPPAPHSRQRPGK